MGIDIGQPGPVVPYFMPEGDADFAWIGDGRIQSSRLNRISSMSLADGAKRTDIKLKLVHKITRQPMWLERLVFTVFVTTLSERIEILQPYRSGLASICTSEESVVSAIVRRDPPGVVVTPTTVLAAELGGEAQLLARQDAWRDWPSEGDSVPRRQSPWSQRREMTSSKSRLNKDQRRQATTIVFENVTEIFLRVQRKDVPWSCQIYSKHQNNKWCKNVGVSRGYEYKFFGADSPCGVCWCCKREAPIKGPIQLLFTGDAAASVGDCTSWFGGSRTSLDGPIALPHFESIESTEIVQATTVTDTPTSTTSTKTSTTLTDTTTATVTSTTRTATRTTSVTSTTVTSTTVTTTSPQTTKPYAPQQPQSASASLEETSTTLTDTITVTLKSTTWTATRTTTSPHTTKPYAPQQPLSASASLEANEYECDSADRSSVTFAFQRACCARFLKLCGPQLGTFSSGMPASGQQAVLPTAVAGAMSFQDIPKEDAPRTKFNCSTSVVNWRQEWSSKKIASCCESTQIQAYCEHIEGTKPTNTPAYVLPAPPTPIPPSPQAKWDCYGDLQVWREAWSFTQKDWCCRNQQLGCYDCTGSPFEWESDRLASCCWSQNLGCNAAGVPPNTGKASYLISKVTRHARISENGRLVGDKTKKGAYISRTQSSLAAIWCGAGLAITSLSLIVWKFLHRIRNARDYTVVHLQLLE